MSGMENIWFPILMLFIVLARPASRRLAIMLNEIDLASRKESAAKGQPMLSEQAIIQDLRVTPSVFQMHSHYIDFWIPSQDKIIPCEVSLRLYNTLQQGQSGILTYQGAAFRSFLRNGEIIYDKC